MVLTSHDRLGDTGKKTGFWLEEFAASYYTLRDAGAEVTLASPKGGQPPLDPKSDLPENQTAMTRRFRAHADARAQLAGERGLSGTSTRWGWGDCVCVDSRLSVTRRFCEPWG
jgi:putative intracellular protease/amidase